MIMDLVPEIVHPDVPRKDTYSKDKDARGWNNAHVARQLCPVHLLQDFDDDPLKYETNYVLTRCPPCSRRFASDVKNGKYSIYGQDIPTFVYDESLISANPEDGFGRGRVLLGVRAFHSSAAVRV